MSEQIDFVDAGGDGSISFSGSCSSSISFSGSCSGSIDFVDCEDPVEPVTQPEPWLYASWRQSRGSLLFGLTGATETGNGGSSGGGAGSDVGDDGDSTDDTGDDDGLTAGDAGGDESDVGDGSDGSGGADVIDDALRTSFSLWGGSVGRSQGSGLPF